jgi:hypothetical protein
MTRTAISREVDHIGVIGRTVRELTGFGTMAFELIQNADDTQKATWLRFDVRDEALWVEDDGGFTDCGDQTVGPHECLFLADRDYRCDFHSFRLVSGADKSNRVNTTGAMGIGFTSVYQITDRPELRSGQWHWIVDETQPQESRISSEALETPHEGTRFVLPWARDPGTPFRVRAKVAAVADDVEDELLVALTEAVGAAMLFLRNLSRIEIARNGVITRSITRAAEHDQVLIEDRDEYQEWRLFRGNFDEEVTELREAGQIEESRAADVVVAVPVGFEVEGRLCATLPTSAPTLLPVHVNADFVLVSDRRHPLMSTTTAARWNAAAIDCAGRILAEHLDVLPSLLGPRRLWATIDGAWKLNNTEAADGVAEALRSIWEHVAPELESHAIAWTSAEQWRIPSGVRVAVARDDEVALPVLERLGVPMAHPDLRAFLNVMQHVGVPALGVSDIAAAVEALELTEHVDLNALPEPLDNAEIRQQLWAELGRLLNRVPAPQQATARARLDSVPLVPSTAGTLEAPEAVWRADERTTGLFSTVLGQVFLDSTALPGEATQVAALCDELTAAEAIAALGGVERSFSTDEGFELIGWFQRHDSLSEDERRDLAALPIFPTSELTAPLGELSLPGGFEDVLGLARLVDSRTTQHYGTFLKSLGAQTLDLPVYVREHLTRALAEDGRRPDLSRAIVEFIAQRWGELTDHPPVREQLRAAPIVECRDGAWATPKAAYFPSSMVSDVLGAAAPTAVVHGEHRSAIHHLFADLGVSDQPRRADVIARVRGLVDGHPTAHSKENVAAIIEWLGTQWPSVPPTEHGQWAPLLTMAWLPQRGSGEWHQPDELDLAFQEAAFRSQGRFVDLSLPVQRRSTLLLTWLGLAAAPTTRQIVDHLLTCSRDDVPISDQVYTELSNRADHPEIEDLLGTNCLSLDGSWRRPDEVFWGAHPFGRWRLQLGPSFANAQRLLDRLDVRTGPSADDAVHVLRDIARVLGPERDDVAAEDHAVMLVCWRMCERALLDEKLSIEDLGELQALETIVDGRGMLARPSQVFFEDLPGLASNFPGFAQTVIGRPDGASRAMAAAGVRDLSRVASATIVDLGDRVDPTAVKHRLDERAPELARVVSHAGDAAWEAVATRIGDLQWVAVTSMTVGWELEVFAQRERGEPKPALTLWVPSEDAIYVVTDVTGTAASWHAVSRELVRAAWPEAPPANLSLGLASVLSAPSREEAATALDDAGIPTLAVDVEAEIAGATASEFDTTTDFDPGSDDVEQPDPQPASGDGDEDPDHSSADATPPADGASAGADGSGGAGSDRDGPRDGQSAGGETGSHGTSTSDPGTARPESRLRSYVVSAPADESTDETDSDSDAGHDDTINEVDAAGIAAVLAFECDEGREPESMPHNNPGYDVRSFYDDGELARWIEVKSTAGCWDRVGVALSPTQFRFAQRAGGEQCWLYVVEYALDPERRRVWSIQDPSERVTHFMFDDGWKDAAEPTGGSAADDTVSTT